MYRNARASRLVDGADEVHKVTIARQTLKNYCRSTAPERARAHPAGRRLGEVRRPGRPGDGRPLSSAWPRRPPVRSGHVAAGQ